MESILNKNKSVISKKELFYYTKSPQEYCKYKFPKDGLVQLELNKNQVYLFTNIEDINFLCCAEAKTDCFNGNITDKIEGIHVLPFYIYYDTDIFDNLIRTQDITKLASIYRVTFLVGNESLESFFSRNGAIFPGVIIESDNKMIKKLCCLFDNKQQKLEIMQNRLKEYYFKNKSSIISRIQQKTGKILIPRYSYEPLRFKRFYEIVKDNFERCGFEVVINKEDTPVCFSDITELLENNYPDIVFCIDKTRNGSCFSGENINLDQYPEIVFINWLQDFYPMSFDKEYIKTLSDRDYVYSFFCYNYLKPYGYKKRNIIKGGIMPVSCEKFCKHELSDADLAKYKCDISFFGSVMTSQMMMDFILGSLKSYMNDADIEIVTEKVIHIIQTIYDNKSTNYITGKEIIYQSRDELQQQLNCSDETAMRIYRVLITTRYFAFRRFILEQIAKLNKYVIHYYGEADINISGIQYGGYIHDETEMSKALQASKIVLQLNPDSTMNQRVLESILSNSMVLIYKMNEDDDMCICDEYLKVGEGIEYFRSKNELLNWIKYLLNNENARRQISDLGRKKVLETLTPEKVMDSMIGQLLMHMKTLN